MDDQAFDAGGSEEFQPQTDDLKKKTAAQIKQSAQQTPEDQSRGALHYGTEYEGDTEGTEYQDAAPLVDDGSGDASSPDARAGSVTPGEAPQTATQSPDETAFDLPNDVPEEDGTRGGGRGAGGASPRSDDRTGDVPASEKANNGNAGRSEEAPALQGEDTAPDSPAVEDESDDVNSAPTKMQISNTEISENEAGAIVGKLSVSDADFGDTHSFSVSDDRFEVVNGHVKLKDGISLDHEEIQALTLEVKVTDSDGASYTESFEIAITDVNEAPTEVSLSNFAVAENVDGAVVGRLSVTDQDVGDTHVFSVSDDRFEVVDGQIKLKDGLKLDHEEASSLTLEVTATDSGGETTSHSFDIAVADVPDVGLSSGFHAKYFDMDQRLESIDDVDWSGAPTHQELVDDINYQNSRDSFWEDGSKDTFGVQITGNIEVEEGGVFNFHIGGDDGVVLFINGEEVVDNDGLHGFRTRSGEIELEPGTHVIEVRYFENYGHAGLKVEWEGPGLDGRELLTPPSFDDLQTVNGMPLSVNLMTDLGDTAPGDVSQVIQGLPPGTILEAGDATATVDDSGSVDVTGWDTSMLHITPPVDFTGQVDAQVMTSVALEDGNAAVTSTELSFAVEEADISPASINVQSGFHASYFDVDHRLSRLDQIDWDSDPTKEEVVGEINYKNSTDSFWEGGDKDTFGARITGDVTIEEGGTFKFFAGGDDGVVLYVNGVEVIDNDGLHGYRTRSGEIELEPGTHEIEVRYFENHGHAGLKLEWEGPGIDGRELVQADNDLSVAENGTLDIGIQTSELSEGSTVIMSGLPADTILVSGDDTMVSDGTDMDLSGWDLGMIELMPPPGFEGTISADVSIFDHAFNGQPREAHHSFEVAVGDTSKEPTDSSNDEAIFLADSQQDDSGDQGWAEDPQDQDGHGSSENSDDDVMDEPVTEHQSSEQSYEMSDTYERNDW